MNIKRKNLVLVFTFCLFNLIFLGNGQYNLSASEENALQLFRTENLDVFLNNNNYINWQNGSVSPCLWEGIICGTGHIAQIKLVGIGIHTLSANVVSNLINLHNLLLSHNQISALVPEIAYIGSNIEVVNFLDLSFNLLSGSIPSSIGNMTNLRALNLSSNFLTGPIPYIGNMVDLWTFDLSNNQLTGGFPDNITELIHLSFFSLKNNSLSGLLPSDLQLLGELESFDISNNKFTGSMPDLGLAPRLGYVDVSNNSLSEQVPPFLQRYSGYLGVIGNAFTCPYPSCLPLFNCSLSYVPTTPCVCNCNANGECVYGNSSCVCLPSKYGPNCESTCPGTFTVGGQNIACSGKGNCSDGIQGTGLCSCFTLLGYGGEACELQCPFSITNGEYVYCNGKGSCIDGTCYCSNNYAGPTCIEACKNGYGGISEGCTIPCLGGINNPCNGHGTCRASDATCDCNAGWGGDACDVQSNANFVVGMIFFGVVIFILMVFGIFLYVRYYLVHRYKKLYHETRKSIIKDEEKHEKTLEEMPRRTNVYAKFFDNTVLSASEKKNEETPLLRRKRVKELEELEEEENKEKSKGDRRQRFVNFIHNSFSGIFNKSVSRSFDESETELKELSASSFTNEKSGYFGKPIPISEESVSSFTNEKSGHFGKPISISDDEEEEKKN